MIRQSGVLYVIRVDEVLPDNVKMGAHYTLHIQFQQVVLVEA